MDYRQPQTVTLGLPPFTSGVKRLIVANVLVYFLMLLASGLAPAAADELAGWLELTPALLLHGPVWQLGRLWQLVTYGFMHAGFWHLAFNMLSLWMFGGELEQRWGQRRFMEFYLTGVVGAALATVGVGYLGWSLYLAHPTAPLFAMLASLLITPTLGASGGSFAVLIGYAMLNPDRRIFIFPLPIPIKARTMAVFYLLLALAGGLGEGRSSVANYAHLGGALSGWLYVKFAPRLGFMGGLGEGYFGLRNRYYRWKRQQAAKKFEVYMSRRGKDDDDKDKWIN